MVAAVHQNIVGKRMTNIMEGKPVNPPLKEYGLFIHKVSRVVLVELQIDRPINMGALASW